jgi:pyruvate dehydrogenase E1 component beta subunit
MSATVAATPTPAPGATVRMTYREAMRASLRDALQRDERVFLMGEDVGRYGGCFAVSMGLLDEFGPERIRDTPLSESTFVGAGIGAALGGMRPIVEIMTVNFSLLALDQIVNNAATILHMSGGQFNIPIVIRMATGGGRLATQPPPGLTDDWMRAGSGVQTRP